MADNTVLASGSGGDTIATDDISGVKYPRSKMVLGADGTNDGDVSSSNPMPCKGTGTAGTANSGVMTVQGIASMTPIAVSDNSGSLTVDNNGTFAVQAVCTNAGTFAVQAVCTNAGTFVVQVDGAALTALQLLDNLVLAEDAVHNTGDPGVQMLAVRKDSLTALAADGDYHPLLLSSSGELYVKDTDLNGLSDALGGIDSAFGGPANALYAGVVRKDTAASIVNTDGDITVLQVDATGNLRVVMDGSKADDADFAAGTTSGTPIMGVYESSPSSITDGDLGVVGLTQTRAMRTSAAQSGTWSVTCTNAGTFAVQAAQSGTWNITNISGTVSLPTGAATAAKQPALGTAGTASSDVITVQGIASMTALTVAQATASNLNATVVGTGTFAVQATCTNAGTFAVQVDGSALTALQLIDDCIFTDDAAFTPGTSKVAVIGAQCDDTATDSVDEGDAGALRMTAARQLIVTTQPHTAGGCTPFYNLDVDESEDAIKGSAGQLYDLYLFNTTNAILYVKLYDLTTGNCTVGTSTPVMTIPVPGNNDTDGAGVVRNWPHGLVFANAITIAATTAAGDSDTGAPGANALLASGSYK